MSKVTDKEAKDDVRRVFSSLSVVAPFAYPVLMMPIIVRRDINTWAGINGVSFYVNPDLWMELTFRQKMFVTMHEWIHVVMQHTKRMKGKRKRIFNYAADFVTNEMIVNDMNDHFDPPKGTLYDSDNYYGKTVEQIYEDLINEINNRKDDGETSSCGSCDQQFGDNDKPAQPGENGCGSCGRSTPYQAFDPDFIEREDAINQLMADDYGTPWGNDLSQMPSDADDQHMVDAIIKAAARAKGMKRGFMPGAYEEYIEDLKQSNIPWERILLKYAKQALKGSSDRNPFKPDPKYLPFDLLIPTEESNKISKLVIIVDTSGSMRSTEFEKACGHIQRFGTMCDKCVLITADTKVHDVIRVKRIKTEIKNKKIKFAGRGGTDMRKAFEEAEKLRPDLIILLSDMDIGEWPDKPRNSQVIFLATSDSYVDESPYGVFIKMKD